MNETLSPDEPLPTRTEIGEQTIDLPEGTGFFNPGQVLGDRYEILEMLGRGGMGEVWRAFDLKLRVEVGLKALREELFQNEGRREMLRQEVRAAREVVSPNVCRIFDLIEIDGRELVSMEYVDGATLLGVLQERGPLELKEAQDIASQFLAGLEAIHKAGLVHRDVKPENIMLTRAGRVVVMDFGLARGPESGAGSVSGTPAYMAPEHAAGQEVDARADVYSAGVVLAEMVSPEGIKSYESRQSVWEGVRSEPAQVPDSPWGPVIQRAVARDRERRPNSAHTLIRELEDVTLRVEGAEDLHPYPGLASFTEEDAEYFFGREAEVEAMWRKLEGPPRMLALVGPSGAGKSSFISAGVIPNAGTGWSTITLTPGDAAIRSLSQALASEFAGDAEAMRELVDLDDFDSTISAVSRWRQHRGKALLVVDQFEELFTLNASGVQTRFTELLGRLVIESDVFVLLSMRDDFFFNCHQFEALNPVVTELTLLGPPTGGALRRALVQPATKCGYRFEDDELVEEMLAEVEGERGALPLLAFALARLWEKRDRETGLLTRQAYHDIGGVGGALARHAEATVDRIGVERIPIVRELFRNLVTAEGTRAVREWDDLLSVFETDTREGINPSPTKDADNGLVGAGFTPARDAAADVLRKLIDARLLTSYEVREDEHDPIRRVEIIHESLLANWPRLVRWQTQDQEGAQLRQELRQSARAWDEHDRQDDRLWTGTAYREFRLWRERYPGGLTEIEETYAVAMASFSGRRRRRRRIAATIGVSTLIAVLAVVTGLWRRSVLHEQQAQAQKLVALGRLAMEDFPTATLAHAIKSLELADSEEARFLALEALGEGPTAFVANEDPTSSVKFSPDGRWIVQVHDDSGSLAIISRDGEQRIIEHSAPVERVRFGGADDLFLTYTANTVSLWSARQGRVLASAKPKGRFGRISPSNIAVVDTDKNARAVYAHRSGNELIVEALDRHGLHERLGTVDLNAPEGEPAGSCIPWVTGDWVGLVEGNEVFVVDVKGDRLTGRRRLGRQEGELFPWCDPDPLGRFFLTVNRAGQIKLWDASGERAPSTVDEMSGFFHSYVSRDGSYFFAVDHTFGETVADVWVWSIDDFKLNLRRHIASVKQSSRATFDPVGLRLAYGGPAPMLRLWSLAAPAGAEPIMLRQGPGWGWIVPAFSPDGAWFGRGSWEGLTMWPVDRPYPVVYRPEVNRMVSGIKFAPDGRFLATAVDNTVSILPLDGTVPPEGHTAFQAEETSTVWALDVSPDGESFSVPSGKVWIGRDGGDVWKLPGDWQSNAVFSPDGRSIAVTGEDSKSISIWNLETRQEVAILSPGDGEFVTCSSFVDDRRLITETSSGVLAWDIETDEYETLIEGNFQAVFASDNGRRLLVLERGDSGVEWDPVGSPLFYDLDTGVTTRLETHGEQLYDATLSRDGTVVATGDRNGLIRVGPATGEEPHLLFGHRNSVTPLDIDPIGRWIASGGHDNTIRLWPMPDLSKPPLHTLPREELIAKLKTLTNIRMVRDSEASTGWMLTHEPFQGWETVPTW